GLGDHHASYSFGPIRPLTQLFPDPGQPLIQPRGFDLCESHPVHSRRAKVGFRQPIGVPQNVRSPDLVVEQVEAEIRFRLRLEIELLLKVPDVIRRFEAHRQSMHISGFLPRSMQPSPLHRRVGIRIATFEACSGFTHVTARQLAQPPKATFVTGLQPTDYADKLPVSYSTKPATIEVEPSSTGNTPLRGTLCKIAVRGCAICRRSRGDFAQAVGACSLEEPLLPKSHVGELSLNLQASPGSGLLMIIGAAPKGSRLPGDTP